MIQVDPNVIPPAGPAKVSHDDPGPLTITITGDAGQTATLTVPAGAKVDWYPPPGWKSATFKATNHNQVFRYIEGEESAG